MKICIIGSMGHTGQAVSEMKLCREAEFVGAAPGSALEPAESLTGYGVPVYADYEEMLDRLKPDIAIVSPVFGLVGRVILSCAQRGIDVFAEKPVAGSLSELAAVEEAVRKSKIHFSAMHFLRFTPSFYHAQKLVRAGEIGEVRLLNAQKSYRFGTRPDWYHNRELYTGTIPWVGIHAIDWIYFFAQKKFKTVSAFHAGNPEMTALCQFLLEDEVFASANIDYLRPEAAPTHGDDRIRVAGTKGVIEVFADHFTLISEKGEQRFAPESAPKLGYDFLCGQEELTPDEIFLLTKAALTAREAADRKITLEVK